VAGASLTSPVRTSKRAPWRGHSTSNPLTSPPASSPPSCVHTSSMAYRLPSRLYTAIAVSSSHTTLNSPGSNSSCAQTFTHSPGTSPPSFRCKRLDQPLETQVVALRNAEARVAVGKWLVLAGAPIATPLVPRDQFVAH